jgi:precorrin-2 dehydrogenase/sirohydrochlorin ferrochelatase
MSFYPINLELKNRICVIVGGGRVAERKTCGLLACGAEVRIISPELTEALKKLLHEEKLVWLQRTYRQGDLQGVFLAIAATDDDLVQDQVYREAEERGILVNVADVPRRCNFILPALVRQGDLTIAVSTGGKSPALAKQLRMELEKRFGPEYKILVDILGSLRQDILDQGRPQAENEVQFNRLLHKDMLRWIKNRDQVAIRHHLETVLGRDIKHDWLDSF